MQALCRAMLEGKHRGKNQMKLCHKVLHLTKFIYSYMCVRFGVVACFCAALLGASSASSAATPHNIVLHYMCEHLCIVLLLCLCRVLQCVA